MSFFVKISGGKYWRKVAYADKKGHRYLFTIDSRIAKEEREKAFEECEESINLLGQNSIRTLFNDEWEFGSKYDRGGSKWIAVTDLDPDLTLKEMFDGKTLDYEDFKEEIEPLIYDLRSYGSSRSAKRALKFLESIKIGKKINGER
jgi:hypothetical protein